MSLDQLPTDVLIQIASRLTIAEAISLSNLNRELNMKLCRNDTFWMERYLQDFGNPNIDNPNRNSGLPIKSWKDKYMTKVNFSVWMIGEIRGHRDFTNVKVPTPVFAISPIQISEKGNFILMLDRKHDVYSFGRRDLCQVSQNKPRKILDLPKIVQISAGINTSLALDEDGRVWKFRNNTSDHNFFGYEINREKWSTLRYSKYENDGPECLEELPPIIKISAGDDNSLLLDETGRVWECDDTYSSNPYIVNELTNIVDISINFGELALSGDGQVYTKEASRWLRINNIPKIIQISSGDSGIAYGEPHGLLLDKHGNVWYVHYEQRRLVLDRAGGILSYLPPIVSITAGGMRDIFIDRSGGVWKMVYNFDGVHDIVKINGLPPVVQVSVGYRNVLFLVENPPTVPFKEIASLMDDGEIVSCRVRDGLFSRGLNVTMEFICKSGDHYLSLVKYCPVEKRMFPAG